MKTLDAGVTVASRSESLTFEQASQRLLRHCAELEELSVSKFVLTTGMATLEAAFDIPGFQPTMIRQRLALEAMRLIMAQDHLEDLGAAGLKSLNDKMRRALTSVAPTPTASVDSSAAMALG